VKTPDRQGTLGECTLNRDTVDGLLTKNAYYGSSVGRVANRIADGRFALEGKVCG
jgi:aldose 1-epimerase